MGGLLKRWPDRQHQNATHPAWIVVMFVCSAMLAAWLRFSPWFPTVLFGDDLINYVAYLHGGFPADFKSAALTAAENKYRPIFHFSLGSLFRLFGADVHSYMVVNWLLHAVNASLVGLLAWRLSRSSLLIGLACAVVVGSSRFALYQVTQVTGLIEGLALTGALVAVVCAAWIQDVQDEGTARHLVIASVAAAALTLHIHERYIVLYPWLIACFWALSMTGKLKQRDLHLAVLALILIGAANYVVRTQLLHLPYFMGTGGQQIQVNAQTITKHLTQAVASLLGFNRGPEHLAAVNLHELSRTPRICAGIFALVAIVLPLRQLWINAKQPHLLRSQLWPILFLMLIGFLLLPAVTTIRLEQRWLLAPQACLLFILANACGSAKMVHTRRNYIGAVTIALMATLILDTHVSNRFDRMFFVYSAKTAESVKAQMSARHLPPVGSPLVLDLRLEHCKWTLGNGSFFEIYGNGARPLACTQP